MSRGGHGLGQNLTLGAHGQLQAELHAEGALSPRWSRSQGPSVQPESHQPTATSLQLQGHLGLPAHPGHTGPATHDPRSPRR